MNVLLRDYSTLPYQRLSARIFLRLGIFSLIAQFSAPAHAAEESATPYRPTVSNPADLSAPGWLELEFGWQRIKGNDNTWHDGVPYLAKLAFTPDWGITLGGEVAVRQTDTDGTVFKGGGDTTLLLKHRMEIDDASAFGVEAGFKAPTAKEPIGSGKSDYLINAIYSRDMKDFYLDLNLSETRVGSAAPEEGRTQTGWAAAVSYALNEKWGIAGELSGAYRKGTAVTSQFLGAVSCNLSKRVVLDVGATRGLAGASQDWSVFAGATILLVNLW